MIEFADNSRDQMLDERQATHQDLPMGLIGGHRGLDVRRVKTAPTNVAEGWPEMLIEKAPQHIDGNQGDLVGVDLYEMNVTAIHNEAFALCEMDGSGFTPRLIDVGGDVLYQEDVGVQDGPLDAEVWRQNCVRMLATIRSRGMNSRILSMNSNFTAIGSKGSIRRRSSLA